MGRATLVCVILAVVLTPAVFVHVMNRTRKSANIAVPRVTLGTITKVCQIHRNTSRGSDPHLKRESCDQKCSTELATETHTEGCTVGLQKHPSPG